MLTAILNDTRYVLGASVKVVAGMLVAACIVVSDTYADNSASLPSASLSPVASIKQAYEHWVTTVTTAKGNPAPVAELYTQDAVLIPTLSPKLHFNNRGDFNRYFEKFTALPGLEATTQTIHIELIDDKLAIASGLYTFYYEDDLGLNTAVPARFTFIFQKRDDKPNNTFNNTNHNRWLIINHHSSVLPVPI